MPWLQIRISWRSIYLAAFVTGMKNYPLIQMKSCICKEDFSQTDSLEGPPSSSGLLLGVRSLDIRPDTFWKPSRTLG